MKHLKLALILILFSVQSVWAESFTFIGDWIDGQGTPNKVYIDSDNIKKNGNFRMVLIFYNYPLKGTGEELSHVAKYEYDCYQEVRKRKSWAKYSEPFGKGEMTRAGNDDGTSFGERWFRVAMGPNDPNPGARISIKIMNIICDK